MALSFEDRLKMLFVPAAVYYRHKAGKDAVKGEPELLHLERLIERGGTLAVDVGANRGVFSYHLSGLFDHVHAFEPNPDMARFARAKLPGNVEVHEVALGADAHDAVLHVPTDRRQHDMHLMGSLNRRPGGFARQFEVTVRTLDSFGFRGVDFIKIDVEGTEEEVLSGAMETIRRDKPRILAEFIAGYTEDPKQVIGRVCRSLGYEAGIMGASRDFVPVETGLADPGLATRNVLFAAPGWWQQRTATQPAP